jgi:hypothetical protein
VQPVSRLTPQPPAGSAIEPVAGLPSQDLHGEFDQFDPTFRDDVLTADLWQHAMVALHLPPLGRHGKLQVARKAVQAVPLFGQQLLLSQPVLFTLLFEGDTLWMSDTPQERIMTLSDTAGMAGHVLVAGGGLGLYPQYLRLYRPVTRVTIVERHPDIVALLGTTLADDPAIEIVQAPFETYITQVSPERFDGCFIDVHPTLDPRWLPRLNWLRNRCVRLVRGPVRIWGYHWMVRQLVHGLKQDFLPCLEEGRHRESDPLYQDFVQSLPAVWTHWTEARLHLWLTAYAHRIQWAEAPSGDDCTAVSE